MTSRHVFGTGAFVRYWNPRRRHWCVRLGTGACYVTDDDDILTTVLGSCVAACVHDPVRRIGGMNHFLLPFIEHELHEEEGQSTRYGVYAMELLVNEVMKAGGRRADLQVKVFGGAGLVSGGGDSGRRNIDFVHQYLLTEGLQLVAADVGDMWPRRLEYHPRSGRARARRLQAVAAPRVSELERRYLRELERTSFEGDIELF